MKKIYPSEKIYLSNSQIFGAGRGVFAKHDIKKGETIETCPVIKFSEGIIKNLEQSILITYVFFAGKNKDIPLLALGYGSLYNHSYSPNAAYKIDIKGKTIIFTAVKDIPKDTEITFNYKQGTSSPQNPLWFESK